jgi:PIN domain nuclease of toxin-antitoxin system
MRAIIDTHVFLWWISDHSQFSRAAKEFLRSSANEPLVSAASLWEMIVKHKKGLLHFPEPVDKFLAQQIAKNRFALLPIEGRHVLALANLPDHHRDPFDRLLVAQSQVENLPIVTADDNLKPYGVEILW